MHIQQEIAIPCAMCQLMAQMKVITVHDRRVFQRHLRLEHGMQAYYIPK